MTSTSFNVGLQDNTRLSSRVLRPPGGGHTDIFGGEPEPARGKRPAPPQPATNVIGQGDEPKPTNGTSEPPQNTPEPAPAPVVQAPVEKASPVSVPEPKAETPKAETPKAEAPKAEAPKAEVAKAEPRAEPPKRVRVPPGGFSSGLW